MISIERILKYMRNTKESEPGIESVSIKKVIKHDEILYPINSINPINSISKKDINRIKNSEDIPRDKYKSKFITIFFIVDSCIIFRYNDTLKPLQYFDENEVFNHITQNELVIKTLSRTPFNFSSLKKIDKNILSKYHIDYIYFAEITNFNELKMENWVKIPINEIHKHPEINNREKLLVAIDSYKKEKYKLIEI